MKDDREQLDSIRKYMIKNWNEFGYSKKYINSLKPLQLREFLISMKADVFRDAL